MKNNYIKFSKEQLIEDLQRVYNENKSISVSIYNKYGVVSSRTVIERFKSFTKALIKANIPLSNKQKVQANIKRKNVISKKMLIDDLLKVFEETSNTTRENYLSHGKYSRSVIKKHFGNWNYCLKELNVKINMKKSLQLTKKEVLDEMLALYNQYGYLNAALQRKKSSYSQSIIDTMFGGFNNLILELKIREPFVKCYTDDFILSSIKDVYNNNGFISCDLIENECVFSFATVLNHFQSIENVAKKLNINNYLINSKLSQKYFNMLKPLIGEPIKEKTFDWLINPNTNRHLYIDGYYPEYNLAIEIHGQQHYNYIEYFCKNIEEFKYNQNLDSIKATLMKKHKIKLLTISYCDEKDIVLKNLFNILQKG